MTTTALILENFSKNVDQDKQYELNELKSILAECYKAQTSKKTVKRIDNDIEKPKKAPSGYNKFIKETLPKLKEVEPDIPYNELMKKAASQWKLLTKQEQENYKNK